MVAIPRKTESNLAENRETPNTLKKNAMSMGNKKFALPPEPTILFIKPLPCRNSYPTLAYHASSYMTGRIEDKKGTKLRQYKTTTTDRTMKFLLLYFSVFILFLFKHEAEFIKKKTACKYYNQK